jgi:protein HIRA/HIR1
MYRAVVGHSEASSHAATAAQINAGKPSRQANIANIETNSKVCSMGPVMLIPCTTSKIISVELTTKSNTALSSTVMSPSPLHGNSNKVIADCTNSTSEEAFSSTLTISRGGVKKWMDVIVGTKATAIAANHQLLVVGTSDGRLYLYGTSPTLGWSSYRAYRAFPPFVLGTPVVELKLCDGADRQANSSCELVVVTSDGIFFVYSIVTSDKPKLNYKGSIIPAMQHIQLQQRLTSPQPNLGRIQITDTNQLMLILVLPLTSPGRLLWGFIYNLEMELWMCVSDACNFVLSDLYFALPSGVETTQTHNTNQRQGENDNQGILGRMERIIRSSSAPAMASAKQMYQKLTYSNSNNGPASNDIITRSHCEDRLACAIALGSSSEFKMWLRRYARFLVSSGNEDALRFLVDILINGQPDPVEEGSLQTGYSLFFLSIGKETLGLNGKDLVRTAILPECLTSRYLQRLTNEISMELLLE